MGDFKNWFKVHANKSRWSICGWRYCRGASLVVWAIRDGRDAATQIEKYLQAKANKNKQKLRPNSNENYQKIKILEKSFNYSSDMEHDACGVGLIASTNGKKSRKIVEYGIEALKAIWHRGAVDADGKSGDGAGIQIEIAPDFFKEKYQQPDTLLMKVKEFVGMVFLPRTDYSEQENAEKLSSQLY